MPWETKFNVEETLEKALRAFWTYGYNATSMRDLTKFMGINSGSIYSTYGSKRELFLSTLKHYNQTSAKHLQKFESADSPIAGIVGVFEYMRDSTLDGCEQQGCFVVNTALEMAPHDKEMSDLVAKGQDVMRAFFKRLIMKGQAMGEISKSLNATDTSELLLGLVAGVRVLTRNRPTRKQFNIFIDNVKLILNS